MQIDVDGTRLANVRRSCENARDIAAGMPAGAARLEVLDSAGHFPWKDVTHRYWSLLTGFVASL
jgi:hypothetical protein